MAACHLGHGEVWAWSASEGSDVAVEVCVDVRGSMASSSQKALGMPGLWATTCDHVVSRDGPPGGRAAPGFLYHHPGPWSGPVCCWESCLGL